MLLGQKIHFIAIGGSVMHGLAIALKKAGYHITGSDDQFFPPSKEALASHDLLPESTGYNQEKITQKIDYVILGMHAKKDNEELVKAQKLGLKILSFPAFLRKFSEKKQRIVIAGSHGKTTISTIIAHVLNFHNKKFDYVAGANPIDGGDSVRLSNDAPIIIFEGDEYLSSPLDPTPKFLHYDHHSVLITGIAWDHINVFPTEKMYVDAFKKLIHKSSKACTIVYYEGDKKLRKLVENYDGDVYKKPYTKLNYKTKDDITLLKGRDQDVPLQIFGQHNIENLTGAMTLLSTLGITEKMFFEAIGSFKGAHKRLNVIASNSQGVLIRDFAHAPSKVMASVGAVKEQFKGELSAFLELHTFSSLNTAFIAHYKGSMKKADYPFVFIDPKVLAKKGNNAIDEAFLQKAFDNKKLKLLTNVNTLDEAISDAVKANNTLLMSSGDFNGILKKYI